MLTGVTAKNMQDGEKEREERERERGGGGVSER